MQKLGSLKIRWVTVLVVFVVTCVLTSGLVEAVENGGIGGKPSNPRPDNPRSQSIFVYELKPGQQIRDAIKIYNNSEQTKNIKIYPVDSVVSSGGAFACAQAADKIKDVGGWIKIDKSELQLAPSQNESVDFVVNVPKDAEPGEHNGCIAIQEDKKSGVDVGNGIALSLRSAIRVAITIPGKITKELTYKDITYSLKSDKIVATILLRNNGNVSLDVAVDTSLSTLASRNLESIKGTYPTFPKTVTELNFEFKRPYWGGWYRLSSTASYNANQDQSVGEGANNKSISKISGWFFVMPQPGALIIELLALAVLAWLTYWLWKRYWQLPRLAKTYKTYHIQKGDELQNLAKQSNVSWKHLAHVNKIKPPYNLQNKKIILLPSKSKLLNIKKDDVGIGTKQKEELKNKKSTIKKGE